MLQTFPDRQSYCDSINNCVETLYPKHSVTLNGEGHYSVPSQPISKTVTTCSTRVLSQNYPDTLTGSEQAPVTASIEFVCDDVPNNATMIMQLPQPSLVQNTTFDVCVTVFLVAFIVCMSFLTSDIIAIKAEKVRQHIREQNNVQETSDDEDDE